jgi:hypothetical protein
MVSKNFEYQMACVATLALLCLASLFGAGSSAQASKNVPAKIFAQRVVEDTLAGHPEISSLELASTPPNKTQCVTIASSEAKGIGEKCDTDEYTAMKTNKPFVEKENENGQEVYDVTLPIHDAEGKIIATAGIDFKPESNQQQAKIVELAQQIAKELESKIKSTKKMFEPAN